MFVTEKIILLFPYPIMLLSTAPKSAYITVYSGLFSRRLYFANGLFNSCSRKGDTEPRLVHIKYFSLSRNSWNINASKVTRYTVCLSKLWRNIRMTDSAKFNDIHSKHPLFVLIYRRARRRPRPLDGTQAYPRFCSTPAPIRSKFFKWTDSTHLTVPRVKIFCNPHASMHLTWTKPSWKALQLRQEKDWAHD